VTTNTTFRTGMTFAVASAVTFGTSGPFAKALMEAGWTPIAAVTARMAGGALALTGTVVVLDVFSGAHVNTVGLAWALGAAVCAACYYVMSDRAAADGDGLHPLTLAAGGLVVGAAAVTLLGVFRILPMRFTANDTVVAGHTTSFLVPIVVLGIVSTAMAYALGISAVARLRPSYASLVGLGEVLAAVAWAWLLVNEAITPTQAIGGAVVLVGLALAGRSGDHRAVESTWPETACTKSLGEPKAGTPSRCVDATSDRATRELIGEQ
jgi:threonine/homoserine efflux transporter RhtA